MQASEVHEQARLMIAAHGPRAIAEAAQKARSCEEQGDLDRAADWRRIEAALAMLSGPRAK